MKLKLFRTSTALILTALTLVVTAATTVVTAQTFTMLYSFCSQSGCANGEYPVAGLVQATDGNLYGTTEWGGLANQGVLFKITESGTLATLYSFCSQPSCADGVEPTAGLVQATDGNLYGTTQSTVFKFTPSGTGTLTTLYTFCCPSPLPGELIQATDGNLYATTYRGGANGAGSVFKITPSGALTTLYSFCSQPDCTDGIRGVGLVQGTDGNFYGTTAGDGGYTSLGTVFKITPSGTLTTLHSFCLQSGCPDGSIPNGGLIQATDGNFYGTTGNTVFKITPSGTLTTLYRFCSQPDCADGEQPSAGLVQGTDGNFYGTTYWGGTHHSGTLFKITSSGTLTTLYSFGSQRGGWGDGTNPEAGLVQATDGSLYGTTFAGGDYFGGTVFSLSVGLGPFVSLQPGLGKVGQTRGILGQGFTGTTAVSFNGTSATFAVVSDTYLRAFVPSGATTGFVTVTTPSGKLASNVPFRVTPQLLSFSPSSGPVGTSVTITGTSLTQTTKIGFGGVAATSFTVNSDTQVTVTVPTGAVTAPIAIQTAGGIAMSSTLFTVTP